MDFAEKPLVDWIIDIGLGAGRNGGLIIFEGYPKEIVESDISLTVNHLQKYKQNNKL